jgi:hypothetical protein
MLRINLDPGMIFADLTFARDGKKFAANRYVVPSPRCWRAPTSSIMCWRYPKCRLLVPLACADRLSPRPLSGSFCRACPWWVGQFMTQSGACER